MFRFTSQQGNLIGKMLSIIFGILTDRIYRIAGILIIAFACVTDITAQFAELQEKRLKEDKLTETERADVLNNLSMFLCLVNKERSLTAANEAIAISKKINYSKGLANGYRNLSILYFYYDESYFISTEYLLQALDLFEELNDSTGIANCYISLGHSYRSLQERDKEIEYHEKAFNYYKRQNDIERIGVTALNTGESYLNNNELEKSRTLLEFAIRVNDSIHKATTLSTCYKAMGILEFRQKNYRKAEADFLKVIRIADSLGINFQKVTTIESMIQLSYVYKQNGKSLKQLEYLNRAAEFSRKHDLINYLSVIYTELIQYYMEMNKSDSVKLYLTEFQSVSDSILSRHLKDRLNQINSIIQVHKLEKDKKELEKASIIQNERLRIRNLILIVVFISVSLLLWLLVKISRKNKKITEFNQILQKQQDIIENQTKHLQELNNTKDKFFSIVAHDLRSPLISLRSFSDLLIDQSNQLTKEEISEMGSQLQANVDNTIKMADTLLTWASLQMKEYEIVPELCYLSEIVSDICDFYNTIALKKGIEFNCSVDKSLTVYGDRNQIAFVLRNLVNNAIKFTKSSGSVKLSAENNNEGRVIITVSDTGTGIKDELKNSLFTFGKNRSVRGTDGEKGTGLGLILSNEFIGLNKGTIKIESEQGRGTTFILSLKSQA